MMGFHKNPEITSVSFLVRKPSLFSFFQGAGFLCSSKWQPNAVQINHMYFSRHRLKHPKHAPLLATTDKAMACSLKYGVLHGVVVYFC